MESKAKANQKKQIEFLQELFSNSSFSQRWKLEYDSIKSQSNHSNFNDERNLKIYLKPQNQEEEKELLVIQKKIAEQAQQDIYKQMFFYKIDKTLSVGDELPHYQQFFSVVNNSEYEIKHSEGEVILLGVLRIQNEFRGRTIQNLQDMITKNYEKWASKVRILILYIDQIEVVEEIINQNNWDKIIHLRFKEIYQITRFFRDLQIQIPFALLTDKKGLINYTGNLGNINLEERINILLDNQNQQQKSQLNEMDSEKYKLAKSFLKNNLPEYLASQDGRKIRFSYTMKLFKKTVFMNNRKIKIYSWPSLVALINKKQVENYVKFKNYVTQSLPNIKLLSEKEQIQDIQADLKKDMQTLSKIYDKFNLHSIENKHCVQLSFELQQGSLIFSRDNQFNQHKKLSSQQLNRQLIQRAENEIFKFAFQKYGLNEFDQYLKKMGEKRILVSETGYQKPICYDQVYRKYKDLFSSQLIQDLKINFNANYDTKFKLYMKRRRVFNSKGQMMYKYYSQPVCKYEIREKDQKTFQTEILDKLFTKFDKNDIIFRSNILKAAQIEEGKICQSCSCQLTIPYYFNYFQKEHYCLACGDQTDPSKGTIEQFDIPHNLILITTHDQTTLNDIDEQKIGKDLQPQSDEIIKQNYYFYSCNGCQRGGKHNRYICLNCHPGPYRDIGYVDFCQECLNKLVFDKDESFMKRIQEKDDEHNFNHIYLKIITPIGGYKNY